MTGRRGSTIEIRGVLPGDMMFPSLPPPASPLEDTGRDAQRNPAYDDAGHVR